MILVVGGGCGVPGPSPGTGGSSPLPAADRAWLSSLARETWDWLDAHRDPSTGFPFDTQNPGGKTNTTNIGLYLAALPAAVELGYLAPDTAAARAELILASLGRLEHRHGFLPNWVPVDRAGDTRIPEGVCAISDFNKLLCGLVLVRSSFPSLAASATALIDRVDWTRIVDAGGGLCYGLDLRNDRPIGNGRIWIASDVRGAVFAAICRGAVPPDYWDRLDRPRLDGDGLSFYGPGYEWGGLFMQAMDAIFLDERGTEMGRSIGDFAWHQIRTARTFGLPLWGWSNCNVPGAGYTEGGFLPLQLVTPHASALALDYYPRHAVANLRALEERGMREPLRPGDPPWGFRDSYNQLWDPPVSPRDTSGAPAPFRRGPVDGRDRRFLSLDQAMLFLAVVNHLQDGLVRRLYASDPLVARGLSLLGDRLHNDPAVSALHRERDGSNAEPLEGPTAIASAAVPRNSLGDSTVPTPVALTWQSDSGPGAFVRSSGGARGELRQTPSGLVLDWEFGPGGEGELELEIALPREVDIRLLPDVALRIGAVGRAASGPVDPPAGGVRILLRDAEGQLQYAYTGPLRAQPAWCLLRARDRSGIFVVPGRIQAILVKLVHRPWFFSDRRTESLAGTLTLGAVEFRSPGSPGGA